MKRHPRFERLGVPAAVALVAALGLTACSKAEKPPVVQQSLTEAIAQAALKGIKIAPYGIALDDDTIAVRPVIEAGKDGVACDNPGERIYAADVDARYVVSPEGELVELPPEVHASQLILARNNTDPMIDQFTIDCVWFDADDKFVNGFPQAGVFPDGKKLVATQVPYADKANAMDTLPAESAP